MATSKLQNCPNETEILQSDFEITDRESESQQTLSRTLTKVHGI
jgi:hypothetical protein